MAIFVYITFMLSIFLLAIKNKCKKLGFEIITMLLLAFFGILLVIENPEGIIIFVGLKIQAFTYYTFLIAVMASGLLLLGLRHHINFLIFITYTNLFRLWTKRKTQPLVYAGLTLELVEDPFLRGVFAGTVITLFSYHAIKAIWKFIHPGKNLNGDNTTPLNVDNNGTQLVDVDTQTYPLDLITPIIYHDTESSASRDTFSSSADVKSNKVIDTSNDTSCSTASNDTSYSTDTVSSTASVSENLDKIAEESISDSGTDLLFSNGSVCHTDASFIDFRVGVVDIERVIFYIVSEFDNPGIQVQILSFLCYTCVCLTPNALGALRQWLNHIKPEDVGTWGSIYEQFFADYQEAENKHNLQKCSEPDDIGEGLDSSNKDNVKESANIQFNYTQRKNKH